MTAGTHPSPSIRRIVVGTDFSRAADDALAFAATLAGAHGAEIILAFVEPPARREGRLEPGPGDASASRIRTALAERAELTSKYAVKVTPFVVAGEPADALGRLAKELKADLVAVGGHGQTETRGVLVGSVAERLVRVVSCPLLVVPARR